MGQTGGEEEPAGQTLKSGPGFWITLLDSYVKVKINVMRDCFIIEIKSVSDKLCLFLYLKKCLTRRR